MDAILKRNCQRIIALFSVIAIMASSMPVSAQALDTEFNIVIMEPLGYGLSELATKPRIGIIAFIYLNNQLKAELTVCRTLCRNQSLMPSFVYDSIPEIPILWKSSLKMP